ncbi:hypothetical protein EI42_03152 [Thermosporothrix hazakensis]|jgi:hypothetical protein|uniref:Uncharacterized protein n=1 Tax=Thermosporothrix hazakensis TaxID=644383 RepID=A0A326U517_THEHA|nr:hypothetical protein [Thermosporothrix hazakensis]PZW28398.1 hypothetical protein EI42_03152 [Thermosporothrix hazakensis]GCE45178.1 hypothetical protein KTH_00470 [Thermosporothrix hazakensis]
MQVNIDEFLTKLEERLTKAETPSQPEPKAESVSLESIKEVLSEFSRQITQEVETKLQKATELTRQEGTGSKAVVVDPMQDSPADYILRKCASGEELTPEEKTLAWGLTKEYLAQGLKD